MNKTASIVMMNNEFNILLYLYLFHRMMEVMQILEQGNDLAPTGNRTQPSALGW